MAVCHKIAKSSAETSVLESQHYRSTISPHLLLQTVQVFSFTTIIFKIEQNYIVSAGLSLRARGREFPPATMSMIPGYFVGNKRKMRPKELAGCSLPHLLTVSTRQLEILVTALKCIKPLMTT